MAQQDTGLGWSALSEWLISVSGQIGTLSVGGPDHGLAVPYYPDDPRGNPTLANSTALQGGDNFPCEMFAVTTPDVQVCIFNIPDEFGGVYTYLCTNTSGVTFNHWWATNASSAAYVYFNIQIDQYDPVTGLYYVMSSGDALFTDIPTFNTLADALDAYKPDQLPISKVNPGYAVACDARWKTTNGTELHSPILISTNSDFVEMSGATGYNLATMEKLLNGVRFYMGFWDTPGSAGITSSMQQVDLTDRGNVDLEQLFMTIVSTSYSHVIIINSPDPYETEGGGSEEDGGDGEETGDDDAGIEAGSDFPSAINTGFCRIFSPSESELRNLSNYLWSNSYDIAQVKKLFSNPMDSILGLSAVPIRLLGSSVSFSLGGVPISGMTLPLVTQQRYTYHMGTITIKERWGSYLDYDPYTKFSIFLPFIGMRELAADDIMGKTVSLVYDIDILTGMCVARLQAGTNCLYEWGGNCAIQLPINSRNWDSVFSTAVSAVGGILSAVTGGSAPLVAGSVASAALQTVSMKPRIDKSSTIGGAAGWLGQMSPYIIRTTPEAFIPTDQNKFIGYPAYINVSLDAISGYNEVESIHLENVTATGAELEEIESILKGGVIF